MCAAGLLQRAPESYADWLEWLRVLRSRELTPEERALLKCGCCTDVSGAMPYIEQQVIETVNCMLSRCIRLFRRDLDAAEMYGDWDGFYLAFRKLAGRMERCLFFLQMTFLPREFRQSLYDSVREETGKFWRARLTELRRQCMESSQPALEDQLYMISRLRLFRRYGNTIDE